MAHLQTPCIDRSRALLARSDAMMIRGCQGHKRNHMMLERGYPTFASRAAGARFTDVDGNELVDYLMGFGPIVLGHGDQAVAEAVARQARDGVIFSTAHETETEPGAMWCCAVVTTAGTAGRPSRRWASPSALASSR